MLPSGDPSQLQRQTQTPSEGVEDDTYISKIDFKIEKVISDNDGHFIMVNETIHQKGITFVNIYAPNLGILKYIKQLLTEIKGKADKNTIIVGDVNNSRQQ